MKMAVDSDGTFHLIEVAAGNDINEFRKQFGEKMSYHGGVDMCCIAVGGEVIEKEIRRITPVIENGLSFSPYLLY